MTPLPNQAFKFGSGIATLACSIYFLQPGGLCRKVPINASSGIRSGTGRTWTFDLMSQRAVEDTHPTRPENTE
jgi:hypothetical protein